MGQLEDMAMFVRIVEAGSISKAAEQLDLAKSAVSRRLNDLEQRLSTQLLTRTTRTSALTDAGEQYYERAKNILSQIHALNEQTSNDYAETEGILKLTAPLSFGLLHLTDPLDNFSQEHKALKLQIDFSDQHLNLIEAGYELAFRIGHLQDSSLQAKMITPIKHLLCASPHYLARYGTPDKPSKLTKHKFLQYGLNHNNVLELYGPQGQHYRIEPQAKIKSNNGDFLKAMALRGHGITCLPTFLVYQAIEAGDLVPVLPHCQPPEMHAYAVYPQNHFLPRRCRALIDYVCDHFGDTPYWDKVCTQKIASG